MEERNDMNCEEARDRLWPPERPKVAETEVVEAWRHVDFCPDCRAFLRRDEMLRRRLGELRLPAAPSEVRERVFQALAEERERGARNPEPPEVAEADGGDGRADRVPGLSSRPAAVRVLAAAAVLTALFLGGRLLIDAPPGPDRIADGPTAGEEATPAPGEVRFVEDFVRRAMPESRIVSSDPAEVSLFIAREVGLPVRPHDFEGFQLLGAEICVVEEKRGAVIFYERNGQVLYHFLVHHDDVTPLAPELTEARPHRWEGSADPSVAIWSAGSVDEALVGDVSPEALVAMARRIHEGP